MWQVKWGEKTGSNDKEGRNLWGNVWEDSYFRWVIKEGDVM